MEEIIYRLTGRKHKFTNKHTESIEEVYITLWLQCIVYFIFAMAGGVFYREFTKWNGYTEPTTLGVLHVHLLVMGTLLFLITALFAKVTMLAENLLFKKFFVLYNIALPAMVVMMLIRGIVQVLGIELGKMGNGMLSGLAGLSHIGMMIAFFLLLFAIKRELIRKQ